MNANRTPKTLSTTVAAILIVCTLVGTDFWISPAMALCPSPTPNPQQVVWIPHRTFCPGVQPQMMHPASWLLYDEYPEEDIENCAELQWELSSGRQEQATGCDLVPVSELRTELSGNYPIICNGNASPNYWASTFTENYVLDEYTIVCPGYPPNPSGPSHFGGKYFVQKPVGPNAIWAEKNLGAPQCGLSLGNPINISTGNKYHQEQDVALPDGLTIERHYNSHDLTMDSFGISWRGSYSRKISTPSSLDTTTATITVVRDDGAENYWRLENSILIAPPDATGRLEIAYSGSTIIGFAFTASDNSFETYDAQGKLLSIENDEGQILYFSYANSLLETVTAASGRSLSYSYYPDNKVSRIVSNNGNTWKYFYDTNDNLNSVEYPGGTTKTYQYEDVNFPNALTGETDEMGKRIRTWAYDANGRAILSTFGNSLSIIERNEITYNPDGSTSTLSPLGSAIDHTFKNIHGIAKFNSVSGICESCGDSTNSATYDVRGNKNIVTDFEGNVTDYDYDANNLLQKVTHAVDTSDQYAINYIWDVDLRKPASITNAETNTSYIYNTRGQVLTRVETDLVTLSTRAWTYTYFEPPAMAQLIGKSQTTDGPRTDVADLTTYEYFTSDHPSGDYIIGDLKAMVNALGQRTEYLEYDANGRLLAVQDPNGVVTFLTYHPRGWVSSRTTAGQTTSFTYDAVGDLTQVTQPDGSFIGYEYDDLHRLSAIFDNFNNRTEYTLNNAGSQVSDETYDDNGVLRRQLTRVYDQLNRVVKLIDGNNDQTQFSYDDNGNRVGTRDANLKFTAFEYDALDRLKTTIDPLLGETVMGYDTRGNLVDVTDPLGNSTSYTIDGLNNQARLDSPDSDVTTYEYDAAGNRTAAIDARGIKTDYSFDALNRLNGITYPDSTLDVSFTYDAGANGKGRLTGMVDAAGIVTYAYDARGNLLSETRVIGADQYVTSYAYSNADLLVRVTYPSGMVIDYSLDAAGRVVTVEQTIGGNTESLVSAVAYEPFGPVSGFAYGNGLTFSADFDLNYQLDQLQSGSGLDWLLDYDPVGNILTIADQTSPISDQSFTYDALYRLNTAHGSYGNEDFDYDANGNRTRYQNGVVDEPYTYEPQSNRLLTQNDWTFSRDAAGNRTAKLNAGGLGQLYDYGDHNRLSKVGRRDALGDTVVGDYTYDGRGQRVSKTAGGVTTHYVYDFAGELLGEYPAGSADESIEYVYLNGQPIAVTRHGLQAVQPPVVERILDNGAAGTSSTGTWQTKTASQDYGVNYLYANQASGSSYRWTAIPPGATYDVYAWWVGAKNQSANVTYTIRYGMGETDTVVKSQKSGGGQWMYLGSYYSTDGNDYVEVTSSSNKFTADAVRWVHTPEPVVAITEETYFIHFDHLGTPRQVSDENQVVMWRWDSRPFGDSVPNEDPDGNLETHTLNLRFPGQYFDAESALNYNYFRTYDPSSGSYVESDPIGLIGGLNLYAYVGGNPIRYSDPTGLETYQCKRPLGGLPGNNQRNGPDIWGNPVYHQYSCTRGAKGNLVCGGQGFSGFWWSSPGEPTTPETDYYSADACRQTQSDNKCFEQCMIDEWKHPRPRYGVPFGTDCQEYDDDVNSRCRKKCDLK